MMIGHQKTQNLTQKTLLQFCSKFFKVTKASSRRFCLLPIIMKSHRRAAAVAAAAAGRRPHLHSSRFVLPLWALGPVLLFVCSSLRLQHLQCQVYHGSRCGG
jgi:hypothetical protein